MSYQHGLNVLRRPAEWDEYKKVLISVMGLAGEEIKWLTQPKAFPALVCSHKIANDRVISAFIYPEEALAFLDMIVAGNNASLQTVYDPQDLVIGYFGELPELPKESKFPLAVPLSRDTTAATYPTTVVSTANMMMDNPALGQWMLAQANFNRCTNAHILSLINLMIELKLISKEAYERKYVANQAVQDRWHEDAKERQNIRKVVEGVDIVLGNPDPDPEADVGLDLDQEEEEP